MLILVVVGMVEIGLAVANLYEIGWAWNILKAWSIAQVVIVLIMIKPLSESKILSPKHRTVASSAIDLSVALLLAASGKVAWSVFWMFLALFSHMKRSWAKTNIEKEKKEQEDADQDN